jgi:hypothetical protein
MIDSVSALDRLYNESFEGELRMLQRRREQDKSLTIETLESTLQALYNIDGNNWEGRSSVQEQTLNAQIDAYEKFIHDWKKELSSTD